MITSRAIACLQQPPYVDIDSMLAVFANFVEIISVNIIILEIIIIIIIILQLNEYNFTFKFRMCVWFHSNVLAHLYIYIYTYIYDIASLDTAMYILLIYNSYSSHYNYDLVPYS